MPQWCQAMPCPCGLAPWLADPSIQGLRVGVVLWAPLLYSQSSALHRPQLETMGPWDGMTTSTFACSLERGLHGMARICRLDVSGLHLQNEGINHWKSSVGCKGCACEELWEFVGLAINQLKTKHCIFRAGLGKWDLNDVHGHRPNKDKPSHRLSAH